MSIKADSWWLELSDQEQWEHLKQLYQSYNTLSDAYREKIKDDESLIELLEDNERFMKKNKPFVPKFGFSVGGYVGLDSKIELDVMLSTNFYFFFFKRLFITPGLNVKIKDNIGGGINLSIGCLF